MELPFAFEETTVSSAANTTTSNRDLPTHSTTSNHVETPVSVDNLPRTAPHYYENVNIQSSSKRNGESQHEQIHKAGLQSGQGHIIPSRATSTLLPHNTSMNMEMGTNGNILHHVALYENVHTHFYNPPSMPRYNKDQQSTKSSTSTDHKGNDEMEFVEDSFVTVCESDANDGKEEDIRYRQEYSNLSYPDQREHHHQNLVSTSNTLKSRKESGQVKTTNSLDFIQSESNDFYNSRWKSNGGDILSLLLSSRVTTPTEASDTSQKQPSSIQSNVFVLCKKASKAASAASKYAEEGNIRQSITNHTLSAKSYREAAIYIKDLKEVNLSLLSYSLLVLSHSQARMANAMLKNGGEGLHQQVKRQANIKSKPNDSTDATLVKPSVGEKKDNTEPSLAKEERLRATIRASMGKAEADMTDSTFLGRASNAGPSIASRKTIEKTESKDHRDESKAAHNQTNNVVLESSVSIKSEEKRKAKHPANNRNPVDDMMELERELRDMDMTLELGVGLGTGNNNPTPKKGMDGEGSFYMIPAGSSYMSSSMMWSSGLGRPQQPLQQTQQQQISAHQPSRAVGRARANKIQTILDASSMSQQKSTVIPGQMHQNQTNTMNTTNSKQQSVTNTSGLESSWWGHASTLGSSTTSLSNSMVGIRSPQHSQVPVNDALVSSSPANTKQLMRLLDSLKTLGDENASLLRELEDARKARLEAKAARESMKQFKEEYSKRFGTLKAALDKFRKEYPDQNQQAQSNEISSRSTSTATEMAQRAAGDKVSSNIVTKSDFVKNAAQAELQKRDQMIQKLALDLKKEREEAKKKDDALRKYENFYKEVKARSAQKARQREQEQRRANSNKSLPQK